MSKIVTCRAHFGSDPEFFLTSGGKIIGCEKVIQKGKGLKEQTYGATIINDGVQVELNIPPQSCRTSLQLVIARTIQFLNGHLAGMNIKHKGADLGIALAPAIIDVPEDEWEMLTEDSKMLGCVPSFNVYDAGSHVPGDANESRMRSAGGHLHLAMDKRHFKPTLIHLMDLVIGNTMVLLDRDERAPERRRVYGRAGEYRLPPHGVEYRTLSNYWLQDPVLVHFVFGLLKFVNAVWCESQIPQLLDQAVYDNAKQSWVTPKPRIKNPDLLASLMERVTPEKVRDAINSNSLDLAQENFEILKEWILVHVGNLQECGGITESHIPPIRPDNLAKFEKWVKNPSKLVNLKNPLANWTTAYEARTIDRLLQ